MDKLVLVGLLLLCQAMAERSEEMKEICTRRAEEDGLGLEWKELSAGEDALPFAGKLVALRGESYYYMKHESPMWREGLRFAYVSNVKSSFDDGTTGWVYYLFIGPEEIASMNALTDSMLSRWKLSMRGVTPGEVGWLRDRVRQGRARLEFHGGQEDIVLC